MMLLLVKSFKTSDLQLLFAIIIEFLDDTASQGVTYYYCLTVSQSGSICKWFEYSKKVSQQINKI